MDKCLCIPMLHEFNLPDKPGAQFPSLDLALADLAPDTVRVYINWYNIQRDEGTYNWAAYDSALLKIANAGCKILATIARAPAWVSAYGRCDPRYIYHLCKFVEQFLFRYGEIVHFIEWENEPDNVLPQRYTEGLAWYGDRPGLYVATLEGFYKAVRGISAIPVVAGGVAWEQESGFEFSFFRRCFDEGLYNWCDVINYHIYPFSKRYWEAQPCASNKTGIKAKTACVRALMEEYGANRRLWCTEVGSGDPAFMWEYRGIDVEKAFWFGLRVAPGSIFTSMTLLDANWNKTALYDPYKAVQTHTIYFPIIRR